MKKRSIGIVLSYVSTFLSMIVGLFMSSFALGRLGGTEYGVYQTISSFVNYLVLLEFGTGTVMVRNLSACRGRGDSELVQRNNIATIWGITNGLATLITVVSAVFFILLDQIYKNSLTQEQIVAGKHMFLFLIIHLLATFYSQTLSGVILACEKYSYRSIVAIVKIILRTTIVVVAIFNIRKALIITIIDAALSVVQVAVDYVYCRRNLGVRIGLRGFDWNIFKTALPLCMALFLQTIVTQANNTVGKFLLGVMAGPEEVTLYSVALYVFSLFSTLATIPLSLYSPQIIKDVMSGKEGKELTQILIQPSRVVVIVSGAVAFGFVAAGKPFIHIFYGAEYMPAWAMAVALMIPMFVNMTNSVTINVLDAKNKRMTRSLIILATALVNVGITIILIPRIGVMGAAIATSVATAIQVITTNVYYSKAIHIKVIYLFKNVYKGVLVFQIIGAVAGYFSGNLVTNPYGSFVLGGGIYVLISLGGYLWLGRNDQEKVFVKGFLAKCRRHKNH